MKVRMIRKFLRGLMLVLGMAALSSGLAAAQSGTFHLSKEVRWGKSVLPAGDYSFSRDTGSPENVMIVRSEKDGWGIMLVAASFSGMPADKDQLVLTEHEGKAFVTSFALKDYGVLNYSLPSEKEMTSTASARMQRPPTLASASAQ